jgi:hypothetical protein
MKPAPPAVNVAPGLSGLDLVGATASVLCAAHCAAMPLLLAALPMSGLEFLGSHSFDVVMVLLALVFGGWVIGRGYRRHRLVGVLRWFAGASILLVLGLTLLHDSWWHTPALISGGLALGAAHLLNLKYLRHLGCTAADHGHPPSASTGAVDPGRVRAPA